MQDARTEIDAQPSLRACRKRVQARNRPFNPGSSTGAVGHQLTLPDATWLSASDGERPLGARRSASTGGHNRFALGKARKGGICDETVKLFVGVQLVQVQPGQSRSGQAGSECCHSSGDRRVRSVHSE
jgi:hypothetical protein